VGSGAGLSEPSFVDTRRGCFAYRSAGDPAGVPPVLQHEWPQSSWCPNGVVTHMPASLRVIAPDPCGLGQRTGASPCAVPRLPSTSAVTAFPVPHGRAPTIPGRPGRRWVGHSRRSSLADACAAPLRSSGPNRDPRVVPSRGVVLSRNKAGHDRGRSLRPGGAACAGRRADHWMALDVSSAPLFVLSRADSLSPRSRRAEARRRPPWGLKAWQPANVQAQAGGTQDPYASGTQRP
jgi:hypothetical protein